MHYGGGGGGEGLERASNHCAPGLFVHAFVSQCGQVADDPTGSLRGLQLLGGVTREGAAALLPLTPTPTPVPADADVQTGRRVSHARYESDREPLPWWEVRNFPDIRNFASQLFRRRRDNLASNSFRLMHFEQVAGGARAHRLGDMV